MTLLQLRKVNKLATVTNLLTPPPCLHTDSFPFFPTTFSTFQIRQADPIQFGSLSFSCITDYLYFFYALTLSTSSPHHPHPHPHHPQHQPHPHPQHHHQQPPVVAHETLEAPTQKPVVGGIGLGSTVKIDFCSSCSYRGNAVTMKRMLETQFPGIDVVLANYPPSLPKRAVAKLVPVFQIGVVGIVLGGEQIFPMLGVRTPPWYYSLRANKFGTIASTWLLGNALQSFLQSSGAFEVYCDDELVFSKLREGRFPGEIELKDIVGRRLADSDISRMLS